MNLLYGEVVEILEEEGMRFGKICLGGVFQKVPLDLVTEVATGDRVLVCDGVAISKVTGMAKPE
jgi:hydrogenase maturation factor